MIHHAAKRSREVDRGEQNRKCRGMFFVGPNNELFTVMNLYCCERRSYDRMKVERAVNI